MPDHQQTGNRKTLSDKNVIVLRSERIRLDQNGSEHILGEVEEAVILENFHNGSERLR